MRFTPRAEFPRQRPRFASPLVLLSGEQLGVCGRGRYLPPTPGVFFDARGWVWTFSSSPGATRSARASGGPARDRAISLGECACVFPGWARRLRPGRTRLIGNASSHAAHKLQVASPANGPRWGFGRGEGRRADPVQDWTLPGSIGPLLLLRPNVPLSRTCRSSDSEPVSCRQGSFQEKAPSAPQSPGYRVRAHSSESPGKKAIS